jgi:hypothetical protein
LGIKYRREEHTLLRAKDGVQMELTAARPAQSERGDSPQPPQDALRREGRGGTEGGSREGCRRECGDEGARQG